MEERLTAMAHTHPYMQTTLVFATVHHCLSRSSLSKLMEPFQMTVWISIIVLMSFSVFMILLSKKMLSTRQRHFVIGGRLNRTPIINLMNVLIGNVVSNRQMMNRRYFGSFARTLMIHWILLWLVLRNAYQGSLYESMQRFRSDSPYDTIEKVQKSSVKIKMTSGARAFMVEGYDEKR